MDFLYFFEFDVHLGYMARYYVTKSDGSREQFSDKKLLGSLLKSELSRVEAKKIVPLIKKGMHGEVTSEDIRNQTFTILCKSHLPHAQLYNLRVALSELEPKIFERYIMKLMERDGYKTEWERIIKGAGTSHEVDISAKKGTDWYLVECKRRRNFNKLSGLGKVLQVRARFEDIQEGFKKKKNKYNFSRAWVINNAKFSKHAKEYSLHKDIWLTGWGYPKEHSLNEWIQHLEFYPVTIFRVQKKFHDMLTLNDILSFYDVEKAMASKAKKVVGDKCYQKLITQINGIRQCSS